MVEIRQFFGTYVMKVAPGIWSDCPVSLPEVELREDEEFVITRNVSRVFGFANYVRYFDDFPVVISMPSTVNIARIDKDTRRAFDTLYTIAGALHDFVKDQEEEVHVVVLNVKRYYWKILVF